MVKDINVSKSSVETSIFPEAWKEALVIPIPKGGNLTLVQNYRPISLLPLPGKILDKLMHKQLTNYLEEELLNIGLDVSTQIFQKPIIFLNVCKKPYISVPKALSRTLTLLPEYHRI